MGISAMRLTIAAAVVMLALHLYYIFFLEAINVAFFLRWARPLVFTFLAGFVFFAWGFDKRRLQYAGESIFAACISVALYSTAFIGLIHVFGAASNTDTPDWGMRLRRLSTQGPVLVLGEILRYKLIRHSTSSEKMNVVTVITFALVFVNLDALRTLYMTDIIYPWRFLFSAVFVQFMASALASYVVFVGGSFMAVLAVGFVYTMGSLLMPVIPYVEPLPRALVTTLLLFFSMLIFGAIMDKRSHAQKRRDYLKEKLFEKKAWIFNGATVAVLGLVVAFLLGAFPLYPVAVLTDSMTGTFSQGSLVIARRVPPGFAHDMVGEGYVIHFRVGGLEYIHRVVAFETGEDGRRVYVTQGDAPGSLVDPWRTTQEDVIGVAVAFFPLLGWPNVIWYFMRL